MGCCHRAVLFRAIYEGYPADDWNEGNHEENRLNLSEDRRNCVYTDT